jgi:hypothetical protein
MRILSLGGRRRRKPEPLISDTPDLRDPNGGPVGPHLDDHDATFGVLARNFFATFPPLRGVRFTHRRGGAIDTSSRFSAFYGRALGGRVSYVPGLSGPSRRSHPGNNDASP